MALSVDLRERAVSLYREGKKTQKEIAERFQVSISSLKRWLNRENLKPDKPGPTNSHKIDRKALIKVVEEKPDAYLDEYAVLLNAKRSTVAYNLKYLGISRKKNHAVPRTKRRKTQRI